MATAPTFSSSDLTGGTSRWVQTAFVVVAALAAYMLHQITTTVWQIFDDPNRYVVMLISFLGGVSLAVGMYTNLRVRDLAVEVATELQRVTWPTRKETTEATVVVIITSVICAILLGTFDAIWSFFTDMIYKVG